MNPSSKLSEKTDNKNFALIVFLIALMYIPYGLFVGKRLEKFGVDVTSQYKGGIEYLVKTLHINPKGLNLQTSYEDWAKAINGSDASDNIKVGLGLADGKGYSKKCLECNPVKYEPYSFRPPATSLAIATVATIFGKDHVYPYFIFTLILQFLCSIFVMLLAQRFLKSEWGIFCVGLLSVFCPPIMNLHYGLGLFMAEPLSSLFLASALYFLSNFWDKFQNNKSISECFPSIILFSLSMTLASYSRDIYGAFLIFICLLLFIHFVLKREHFKTTTAFIAISLSCLFMLQLPWMIRNKHVAGSRVMATSSNGVVWRAGLWMDHKEADKWCGGCGLGLGHYLSPLKAKEVENKFATSKERVATLFSIKTFLELIIQHPWKAFMFKASRYDFLWFGGRPGPLSAPLDIISYWSCAIGCIFFLIFLFVKRWQFYLELWAFPLFILALSSLIHFEHRYSHPFFLLITPVTTVYVMEYFYNKFLLSQKKKDSHKEA